jgi:adenine phosphoribosyltransferase
MIERIKDSIRDVKDFPEEGIIFKDITPVLQDPELFAAVINLMSENCQKYSPKYIVGLDARGFILGAAIAKELGCGFIPIRKKGKLPYSTISKSYDLEYGSSTLEIHSDALAKGDGVVIVDDLLATGGTMAAAIDLIKELGADVLGIEFLIELSFLNGSDRIKSEAFNSIINVK